MFLALLAKHAVLSCSADGESSLLELIFECSATQKSGVLEIGNKHIFASKDNIPFSNKRHACELRLDIKRRSCLPEGKIAKLGLSSEKIGELGFYPDSKARDFVPAEPASLYAFVFVSDSLFDNLIKAAQSGRKTELIYLEIEKKGTLEYGWEPDGSRMVWKIDDATEPSYVNVTRLEIRLSLFG